MGGQDVEICKRRWPRFAPLLDENRKLPDGFEPVYGTLRVEGIHLTSRDRQAEAELQATALLGKNLSHVWVYGFALGDLPRLLLRQHQVGQLRVVILNKQIFCASMWHFSQGDWLSDPRVELVAANELSSLHSPYVFVPSELQLTDDDALFLRDEIALEAALPFQQRKYAERQDMYQQTVQSNRDLIQHRPDVAELFRTTQCSEKTQYSSFAVAAAGPTLAENLAWLASSQKQLCIIATNTSLKPLLQAGITPHVVVAVDGKPELADHFASIDRQRCAEVPLVFTPIVHSEILNSWPGPLYCAYTTHERYQPLQKLAAHTTLFSSGSVTHVAVDLAVKMGAKEITLLGADFSYVGGNSHVNGAAQQRTRLSAAEGRTWLTNEIGQRVWTDLVMVGYLRDLERYIAVHPEVAFYRGSPHGAAIKGTTVRPETRYGGLDATNHTVG